MSLRFGAWIAICAKREVLTLVVPRLPNVAKLGGGGVKRKVILVLASCWRRTLRCASTVINIWRYLTIIREHSISRPLYDQTEVLLDGYCEELVIDGSTEYCPVRHLSFMFVDWVAMLGDLCGNHHWRIELSAYSYRIKHPDLH